MIKLLLGSPQEKASKKPGQANSCHYIKWHINVSLLRGQLSSRNWNPRFIHSPAELVAFNMLPRATFGERCQQNSKSSSKGNASIAKQNTISSEVWARGKKLSWGKTLLKAMFFSLWVCFYLSRWSRCWQRPNWKTQFFPIDPTVQLVEASIFKKNLL